MGIYFLNGTMYILCCFLFLDNDIICGDKVGIYFLNGTMYILCRFLFLDIICGNKVGIYFIKWHDVNSLSFSIP